MKHYLILAAVIVLFLTPDVSAKQWYVGPEGRSASPGTRRAPWDIASALEGKHRVAPGDTVFLLGGTYKRRPKELFDVKLVGTEKRPIHVRPVPGARVTIDGGLSMQKPSAHVWIWDLEILVSEPVPAEPISPGSHPKDLARPHGGLNMFGGRGCKYIHIVIHDTNQAISCWKNEIDPEIYGCLIYNNGWLGKDRGHGHAIYTQNKDGVKRISNCIMSCRYGGTYTMHAYGSRNAWVDNYVIEDNIAFHKGPFLVGGGRPSRNIRVARNYLYGIDMRIGYNAPHNENCEVRDNVIVNGRLNITRYKKVVEENNLVLAKGAERPKGAKVVLLPSKYDPRRAHLVIFNWQKAKEVEVTVAPFLKTGQEYRILNPQDFYGKPVLVGKCRGKTITVPMEGEFAAFVILRDRRGGAKIGG